MRTELNLAKTLSWLGLTVLLATSGITMGCANDPEEANASPVSPQLTAESADKDDTTALGNPADLVEELANAVELTAEQKSALTSTVEALQTAMAERRAQGPRQGPPSADEDRPMRTFLVASAEILDPDQTVAWFELLAQKREELRDRPARLGRGDGPGRGGRQGHFGPRGEGRGQGAGRGPRSGDFDRPEPGERLEDHLELMQAVLDLSDTQVANLRTTLIELAEQWRTTREELERGSQELRDAARAHHEAVQAAMKAELTEEQAAVADALAALRPQPHGPRGRRG